MQPCADTSAARRTDYLRVPGCRRFSLTAAIAAAVEASSTASGSRSNSQTRCGGRRRTPLRRRGTAGSIAQKDRDRSLTMRLSRDFLARAHRQDQRALSVEFDLQAGPFRDSAGRPRAPRLQAHLLHVDFETPTETANCARN